MASPTQWAWVWVNSGSWWWTGRPGVLRFMGLQRVGHNWATELNWADWYVLPKCSNPSQTYIVERSVTQMGVQLNICSVMILFKWTMYLDCFLRPVHPDLPDSAWCYIIWMYGNFLNISPYWRMFNLFLVVYHYPQGCSEQLSTMDFNHLCEYVCWTISCEYNGNSRFLKRMKLGLSQKF